MRTDRGRWFWVALIGNVPIVLFIGLVVPVVWSAVVNPDVGVDSASSFSPIEGFVVVAVASTLYLAALVRYAMRKSWVWLLPFDIILGAFFFVGALGNIGAPETRGQVLAVLLGGVALVVAAAAIVLDRRARQRALADGTAAGSLGDPTARQAGIIGFAFVGVLLLIWLWSAVSEAEHAERVASGIPPAWLTLGLVATIVVVYAIGLFRHVTRRGSSVVTVIGAIAGALLLVHLSPQLSGGDIVGSVTVVLIGAMAAFAALRVYRERVAQG